MAANQIPFLPRSIRLPTFCSCRWRRLPSASAIPPSRPYISAGNADHDNLFHFYAEDTWKIRPRFSLNYGLAWSYESNALNHDLTKPAYLAPIFGANGLGQEQHSPHNFSPMLGFAWTVTKDNKTVVRGGSAIYYDTWDIFNRLIERVILGPVGTGRIPLPDSIFLPGHFRDQWLRQPAARHSAQSV